MNQIYNDLPIGWVTTTLGEVTQLYRPRENPKIYPKLPFIGMENIEAHSMRLLGTVPANTMKSNAVHFFPNDVLYGRLRPYLNKVFRPDFEGLCSSEFIVFPASEHLNARFLQYLLNSIHFVSFASHLNEGDRPRVDFNQIGTYKFRLPPLREQARIVARIEELFTQLDASVEELLKAQAQLKRYRQTVLKAAVTGELTKEWREAHKDELEPASELLSRILRERRAAWGATQLARKDASPKKDGSKPEYREPAAPVIYNLPKLPEGWTWANISQVGQVTGGLTKNPRRKKLPAIIPYLRVANVYAGELDLTEVKNIGIDQSELERVLLSAGDLLVVEGNGSIDQIGRVALWDGKIASCAHQNHLIKVRFNQPKLGKYILWWLLSSDGRNFITRIASSTSGLHTLSISKVASLPLPLPPILEQEQIVSEIERVLSIADVLQQALDVALRQAERIRQSILKQAFEGNLVPQDPNDEPAELLLERIREERANREAEKQAEAKSNRKRFTKSRTKRTERPAA